jgi:hypothetical protein
LAGTGLPGDRSLRPPAKALKPSGSGDGFPKPGRTGRRRGSSPRVEGEAEAVRQALQILEEDVLNYRNLEWVTEVVRKLAPEADHGALAKRVLREAKEWTMGALDGLWRALGVSFKPPWLERALDAGYWMTATLRKGREEPEVVLWVPGGEDVRLPLRRSPAQRFQLVARIGRVRVEAAPGLFARRGRVFLQAQGRQEVEEAFEVARTFRPLFQAMELADLEDLLEVLARLEDGEGEVEGPHVLFREGEVWTLRTGLVLGDLSLTRDFIAGRRVVLSYPHGLQIALKGGFWERWLQLRRLVIRWGEEAVRFEESPALRADPPDRDPVGEMIREALKRELSEPKAERSPRMRALLEELSESENPLEAPKSEEFFRKVHMRALAKF